MKLRLAHKLGLILLRHSVLSAGISQYNQHKYPGFLNCSAMSIKVLYHWQEAGSYDGGYGSMDAGGDLKNPLTA
ncbi:MAG: hypothetical protein U5P10_09805 [Spirochaetia bacterium]|nr:hypothetical protein [Spirochaetia bacterium]